MKSAAHPFHTPTARHGGPRVPAAERPRADRPGESGLALLAVLGILTILAIIATAFAVEMRFEERAAVNYVREGSVRGVTEAGAQVGAAALVEDYRGLDGVILSGDERDLIDHDYEQWRNGFRRTIAPGLVYNLTRYIPAPASQPYVSLPPPAYQYVLTDLDPVGRLRFRYGTDEDPQGDISLALGLDGTSCPGLCGVDDDLDGLTDEDSEGREPGDPDYTNDLANDDDEDGLVDEDRPDIFSDAYGTYELFIDQDGDRTGIFDESAKLDLNHVSNLSQASFGYSHGANSGYSTYEIDLAMFIYGALRGVGVSRSQAQTLAADVVAYRHGSGRPGGTGVALAGEGTVDDNLNNNWQINIGGNDLDDNFDNVVDDVLERYIGPRVLNIAGDRIVTYYPGDRLDNDGDGLVDENFSQDSFSRDEGVDEPSEFRVNSPFGDDNPFNTLAELELVPGFSRILTVNDGLDNNGDGQIDEAGEDDYTIFELLEPFLTVYSASPKRSPHFGGELTQLNINFLNNYTPPLFGEEHRRRGFDPLTALAVDNDLDWRGYAWFDGDGDGEEESDDINGNRVPDGNWSWEADTLFGLDAGIDTDSDRWAGTDDGDHNADGNVSTDPEPHVNEDGPFNAFHNYNQRILDAAGITDEDRLWVPGIAHDGTNDDEADDDGDGEFDENDLEVIDAIASVTGTILVADEVDNDWDGLTDEPGETYIAAFDDDEDGIYDEDPSELELLLRAYDYLDQLGLEEEGGERYFLDPTTRYREALARHKFHAKPFDPNVQNVEMANPGEFYLGREGVLPEDPTDRSELVFMEYEGVEGIRINEVMAEPYMRLSPLAGAPSVPSSTVDNFCADTNWQDDGGGVFRVTEDPSVDPACPGKFGNDPETVILTYPGFPDNGEFLVVLRADPQGSDPVDMSGPDVTLTLNGQAPDRADINAATWTNAIATGGQFQVDFTVFSLGGPPITASIASLELIAEDAQYIELVNVSSDPIDLFNWQLDIDGERTVLNTPTIVEPGEYVVLTRDETILKSIYDPIYDAEGLPEIDKIIEADFVLSASDEDFINPTVPERLVNLTLFDPSDGYVDSAEVRIAYEDWQNGFEAFERADPTAVRHEARFETRDFGSGPVEVMEIVTTHPWGDLYLKDATIPETSRAAYEDDPSDGGWRWDPRMTPLDDDFLCYESEGDSGPDAVEWRWENVRMAENKRFRIRAYGEEGQATGSFVEIADEIPPVAISVPSGQYLRFGGNSVNISADTTMSIHVAADIDNATGLATPFKLSHINLVTAHQGQPFITGSPGKDNAAFSPDTPLADAPLVKNGLLATPGELLQVTSGEEFKRGDATTVAYLIDYLTTAPDNALERRGLVNINTAPRVVLMALPWAEPGANFNTRFQVAEVCSWVVWQWAHRPLGLDTRPGIAGFDDDGDGSPDVLSNGLPDAGELNAYGSDDGPFNDLGELLMCFRRSEVGGQPVMDVLRGIQPEITEEGILARLSSVATVRSSVFSVYSSGRVLDVGNQTDELSRIISQKRVLQVVSREEY